MVRFATLASAVSAVLLVVGCTNDPVGTLGLDSPPSVPSLASMTVPSLDAGALAKQTATAGLAHAGAVATVSFWTNLTAITLSVPVSLFTIVHSTDPIALPDGGGWMWVVAHDQYRAVLTAVGGQGVVEWTMTVSCPEKKDFVWFEGASNIEGTVGDWIFNDFNDGQAKYRFSYNAAQTTFSAKASVVDSDDPAVGNYLSWKTTETSGTFQAFSAPDRETITIVCDFQTGAGRMTSVRSGNSHCWGARTLGYPDIYCDQLSLQ